MRPRMKLLELAPHVVMRVIDESVPGETVGRIRLEGHVFGAKGQAVKPFATPSAAGAFFDAFDETAAEAWWCSLQGRVAEEFAGFVVRGAPGAAVPEGLLHA